MNKQRKQMFRRRLIESAPGPWVEWAYVCNTLGDLLEWSEATQLWPTSKNYVDWTCRRCQRYGVPNPRIFAMFGLDNSVSIVSKAHPHCRVTLVDGWFTCPLCRERYHWYITKRGLIGRDDCAVQ